MNQSIEKRVVIVGILASGVAMLDGSVVNVALPAIERALGGGLATQQWVIDGYMLTLSAFMLIAGALSDSIGRMRIMRLGLLGFGVASLICALSPSGWVLVAARLLQGVAGALLVPSSLALIIAAFPDRTKQGKAIGTWTAWTGISFLVGPVLGGLLVDYASWRWIFAINVFPILLTLALLAPLTKLNWSDEKSPVDYLGSALCALGFGGTIFALISQPTHGWTSPYVLPPLVIGLALLSWFFWHEAHTKHPMLPMQLFAARNFRFGNLATLSIYAGLSATYVITIFIQQIAHYNALEAGLAMLPVTVLMFFLSSKFGALAGKYGPRLFMSVGPLIAAIGFLFLLTTTAKATYLTQVLPAVLLFGLGLSITVAPLTAAVLGSIDARHAGVGSAINNAVARVAGLLAVALSGLVIGQNVTLAGFHRSVIAMAILLLGGSLVSAIGITNKAAAAKA